MTCDCKVLGGDMCHMGEGCRAFEKVERLTLQRAGNHPAPCARHCEANAYEIEIRRVSAERDEATRRSRLAERNLLDAQEAGKKMAKQAFDAERERDALVAKLKDAEHDRDEFRRVMNGFAEKLAELEGQEPAAWMTAKRDMASFVNFHDDDLPLYDRPVPAEEGFVTVTTTEDGRCVMVSRQDEDHRILSVIWEAEDVPTEPVTVDFGKRGKNMFFKIGNQSFLLDYKPEEQAEFDFMKEMLLSAFYRITQGVKTETQPVNARLMDALKRAKDSLVAFKLVPEHANCWEPWDEENLTALNSAIAAAEAQQERLLQDMHDAGREIDRVMAEPAPKAVRLTAPDIVDVLRGNGLYEDSRAFQRLFPILEADARAIETAVLRKNGIEVAE